MRVSTQSVNFTADVKLKNFIEKRLEKLELFNDKIVGSEVFLKVENSALKENKTVEIKLLIPGDRIVVKKTCKTFEEATQSACDTLRRKLLKKKNKRRVHHSLKFSANSFV